MSQTVPWHEEDAFWETWDEVMFRPQRIADAASDVDKIMTLLEINPGTRVLDLCCGVGRHSVELARHGCRVTGVDRTRKYLDAAIKQAGKEDLDIEFIQEDMRTFCRPDAFDAVINMFTSFGYFADPEEDWQVATNIYRSLKTGGLFLMDIMGKEVLARIFQERGWSEEDGIIWLQERKVSQNWGWMWNRWIMLKGNERIEWEISHRLYSATEMVSLLKGCGFTAVDVYGGLDGSPYDHTARRMVTVVRK
ncbi:MAG TPA: class I SAM-dependent methyltransferase [Dehalococcoidia bacterium]|nr:class I SAM-dependent methyltransferase [Dehalococcoidia bacterium]